MIRIDREGSRAVSVRRIRFEGADCVLLRLALREDPRIARLTASERQVMWALVSGDSNSCVASARRRSVRTVANQVRRIFEKTGVSSRADLAVEFAHAAVGPEARAAQRVLAPALGAIEARTDLDPSELFGELVEGRLRCVREVTEDGARQVLFARVEPPAPLSARQARVLSELVHKSAVKVIARDLGVSDATVWSEIAALHRLLGFDGRQQMLRVVTPLAAARGA